MDKIQFISIDPIKNIHLKNFDLEFIATSHSIQNLILLLLIQSTENFFIQQIGK